MNLVLDVRWRFVGGSLARPVTIMRSKQTRLMMSRRPSHREQAVFKGIQNLSDRLLEALAPKATVRASWYCEDFCYCDSRGRTHARSCTCSYDPASYGGGIDKVCSLSCSVIYYGC
jgi:hypothetical protein